jgi:hypothetical protein
MLSTRSVTTYQRSGECHERRVDLIAGSPFAAGTDPQALAFDHPVPIFTLQTMVEQPIGIRRQCQHWSADAASTATYATGMAHRPFQLTARGSLSLWRITAVRTTSGVCNHGWDRCVDAGGWSPLTQTITTSVWCSHLSDRLIMALNFFCGQLNGISSTIRIQR